MANGYYSNGRARVNGYSEEDSALADEYFAEAPGAVAARNDMEWEGYWAAVEAEAEAVRPDAETPEARAERVEAEVLEAKFNGIYD